MEFPSRNQIRELRIAIGQNLESTELIRDVVAHVGGGDNQVLSIDIEEGGIVRILLEGNDPAELDTANDRLVNVITSLFGRQSSGSSPRRQYSSPRTAEGSGDFRYSANYPLPPQVLDVLRGREDILVDIIREHHGLSAQVDVASEKLLVESDERSLLDGFSCLEDKFPITQLEDRILSLQEQRVHIYIDLSNVQIGEIIAST